MVGQAAHKLANTFTQTTQECLYNIGIGIVLLPWVVFFLRSLEQQIRRLEKKVEPGYLQQKGRGRGFWYELL